MFLVKLFSKKGKRENIAKNLYNSIVPEIQNLLWIENGPMKNYQTGKGSRSFDLGKIKLTISINYLEEPSLIDIELPVSEEEINPKDIVRPPYFPQYSSLTPEQRKIYWMFLNDPYSGKFDIGYVFLFYYGLERQLLEGNFDEAFKTVIKLRDVYPNKSFQSYSSAALILTAYLKQRPDLANLFYESINKEYENTIEPDLYFMCKTGLGNNITAEDIIKYSKDFGFTKTTALKKYPDIFLKELKQKIAFKYNSEDIPLTKIIGDNELINLRKENKRMFANTSIGEKGVSIPSLLSSKEFKQALGNLLEEANESTKQKGRSLKTAITKLYFEK